MTFSTIICLSLALFAGVYADGSARIVGGMGTTIEQLPFIVSLRLNGHHFCAGSIISERHILTAAHCVFSKPELINSITVVTGSTNSYGPYGLVHGVSHVVIHPDFSLRPYTNMRSDIAILVLRGNIVFNRATQRINLPTRETVSREIALIAGWGHLSAEHTELSPTLQIAYTTIIGNPMCSVQLRNHGVLPLNIGQICAFERPGVGTCIKDSGGPLVANNQIIGVASFGIPCAVGFPDVFTRVFTFKPWIERVMMAS